MAFAKRDAVEGTTTETFTATVASATVASAPGIVLRLKGQPTFQPELVLLAKIQTFPENHYFPSQLQAGINW